MAGFMERMNNSKFAPKTQKECAGIIKWEFLLCKLIEPASIQKISSHEIWKESNTQIGGATGPNRYLLLVPKTLGTTGTAEP